MATISNKNEATFTDGSGPTGDILNVNTVNARVELPNGAALAMFSDAYTTLGLQLKGGTIAPLASTSAAAITNGATITTAGVGIARVAPASAVTGIILQAGTFNGQQVWVSNEAAVANTVSFASSGTSAVADGQNDVIPGLSARLYVWNSVNFLWYATPQTVNGTLTTVQSATASAVATNGTITTAGVGVARVAPSAAVTGIILQAGTLNGQQCWVVNEAAVANSLAFAASGTSLVADGVNDLLPGLSARLYVWDSPSRCGMPPPRSPMAPSPRCRAVRRPRWPAMARLPRRAWAWRVWPLGPRSLGLSCRRGRCQDKRCG